jgi:hypothetical protein
MHWSVENSDKCIKMLVKVIKLDETASIRIGRQIRGKDAQLNFN